MEKAKRIYLLSPSEIIDLYSRPIFYSEEQKPYFSLNQYEQKALNQCSNRKTRLYFILKLGYFKAKQNGFIILMMLKATQNILRDHMINRQSRV